MNIVVNGMATIARGSGWPFQVVRRIERFPPVGSFGNEIGAPYVMDDVPLSRLGEIVITDFREVALLPDAAVDEG
jgi:hypothetical protein